MVNIDPTILQLVLLWMGYFIIHSVLASQMTKDYIKAKYAGFFPCYRLAYNLIAIITLIPIAIVHFQDNSSPILLWPEWSNTLTMAMTLAALGGFIWSLKYYDMSVFSGLSSCQRRTTESISEGFSISPMHRFVRHP